MQAPPRDRPPGLTRGGVCARLFLLLPVLALLLGALGPFAAAPAQAQTTVWSATLTVDYASTRDGRSANYGCDNASSVGHDMENCSTTTVLTDDDFDYPTGGTAYTIDRLNHNLDGSVLSLGFSGLTAAAAKTALTGLTLTVGSGMSAKTFAIADATAPSASGSALSWSSAGLSWSDGGTVSLSLTAPAAAKPAKPAGLTATAGNAKVDLSWTDPSDSSITKYRYRQKEGSKAWGSWTDIPSSSATTTSHAVTGLKNGTAYRFRIRAVNAGGEGPQSAVAEATPAAATTPTPSGAVWSATLTVDLGSSYGCNGRGTWPLSHDACSSALTDDDFTHGGVNYTIDAVTSDGFKGLLLRFSGIDSATAKTALSALTLRVGAGPTAQSFRISDATVDGAGEVSGADVFLRWASATTLGWSANDMVALSLTAPATNSAATGKPSITGTATVGQTLTAAKGTVADTNGLTKADNGDAGFAYTYQWIRVDSDGSSNAADISGATSSTYVLASADQGKRVKVKLSFQDDAGNAESRTSDAYPASGAVAAASTTPTPSGAVWSATLTVDHASIYAGCETDGSLDDCATMTVLSDDDFMYGEPEQTFTITNLYRTGSSVATRGTGTLDFRFSGLTGAQAKTALSALTLTVAKGGSSTTLKVSEATASGNYLKWDPFSGASWGDGDTVSLSLTAPAAKPAKPTGLTATAGDKQVALSWTDPSDSSITKYQVRQKEGSNRWGSWTNIPSSSATTTSYAVTGLKNGTAYRFRIRAVNAAGEGPQSAVAEATPAAATTTPTPSGGIWSATLTVQASSASGGCSSSTCPTALTQDEFTHGGIEYTIEAITLFPGGSLFFWTNKNGAYTALSALTLTVGSGPTAKTFKVSDATMRTGGKGFFWTNNQGLSWSANDMVALALTEAAPAANSAATGKPSVTGTATVGQTLTAAKGTIADANGVTKADNGDAGFAYTYQWIRVDSDGSSNAADISGATSSTYVLKAADRGKRVKVKLSFKDDAGNAESRTSDAYPASGTVAASDTTAPEVTSAETGYYSEAGATTALTGPLKSGADIYTKVTFSEDMKHVKSDAAAARPELFRRIGDTDTQYHVLDSGDTLASGDCRPEDSTSTDVYICFYTVGSSDSGAFTVKAGTNSEDEAGNALAAVYTHAATLTLDTTAPAAPSGLALASGTTSPGSDATPSIEVTVGETGGAVTLYSDAACTTTASAAADVTDTETPFKVTVDATSLASDGSVTFYAAHADAAGNASACSTASVAYVHDGTDPGIVFPSGVTPTAGTAATIALTDATAKIAKYGAIPVAGTETTAAGCDTAAEIGSGNLTTLATPSASEDFEYTPPADSVGKKVCAYAEDAAGNSHAALWNTAIAQPVPAQPTGLRATAGNAQVDLAWTDPSDSTITKYQVAYKKKSASGDASFADITGSGATTTSHTVTGLDNGDVYQFWLRAVNSGGNGTHAGPVEATPASSDTTAPTVTAGSTGFYGEAGATTALTGPLKSGADIYTKVTFSEDMKHVKSDAAAARPELSYRIGTTDTQYHILDSGDTLASGDCRPEDSTSTDVYICFYTVGSSDSGAFTVKAGTNSEDEAGNALAAVYTHAATLTLDTTAPAAPVSLAAEAGDAKVTLTWSDPSPADATISKWQYRQKTTGSYGEWQDVTGGASARSVEVGSLSNGTAYTFQVRAVDTAANEGAAGTTDEVTPAAANAAPAFSSDAAFSVAENQTAVGTVAAADADSADSVTYAVTGGADQAKFAIVAGTGVLTFAAAPDFEDPQDAASTNPSNDAANNEYVLVVTATGGTGARAKTAAQTIVVTVTNVDEAGSVTFGSTTPRVGDALMASVEDPDGGVSSVTWQWAKSSTKGGTYADISGATSASYTPAAGDADAWLRATAGYTDAEGTGKSANAVAAAACPLITEPLDN